MYFMDGPLQRLVLPHSWAIVSAPHQRMHESNRLLFTPTFNLFQRLVLIIQHFNALAFNRTAAAPNFEG